MEATNRSMNATVARSKNCPLVVNTTNKLGPVQHSRYNDWLRAGSNPGGGEIFRARPDELGAHPDSHTMGTGSFPGVQRPGRGVDHSPPPSAEVKERVKLYLHSTSGPSWPVLG
jgi:hypothetical protein